MGLMGSFRAAWVTSVIATTACGGQVGDSHGNASNRATGDGDGSSAVHFTSPTRIPPGNAGSVVSPATSAGTDQTGTGVAANTPNARATGSGSAGVPSNVATTDAGASTGAPGNGADAGASTGALGNSADGSASDASAPTGRGFDLRDYTLGGVTAGGSLIGVRWTGSEEVVDLIDPATSASTFVGVLGDLNTWSGQLAYDPSSRILYAAGDDATGAHHLYSFSLETGTSTSVPFSAAYTFDAVTGDGKILGAYWSGSQEVVTLIDPAGDVVRVGVFGDLTWWSDQMSYDEATRTVYAIGGPDTGGAYSLYSLSLDTGASTKVPIAQNYAIANVTDRGRLVGAYWTGSDEPVIWLDPTTGIASNPAGVLGDLYWWQGQIVYDATRRITYAIGQGADDVSHLYRVDFGN